MAVNVRTSQTHPLMIDELPVPGIPGVVGMTLCPGKQGDSVYGPPWRRDLTTDLAAIRAWGASAVVTLMEEHEFALLGIGQFQEILQQEPFAWYQLPVRDLHIPDEDFEQRWERVGIALKDRLTRGERVLIHCRGGLGRTGTIAARLLVEFGLPADEAIHRVRAARPGTIETTAQERYVGSLRPRPWRRRAENYAGCLLGGAVGDALGWPVEFMKTMPEIRQRFGHVGIVDPVRNAQGLFEITDDTQMTLFTAEGLLRAGTRARHKGIGPSFTSCTRHAYQRWMLTQGERVGHVDRDGWLITVPELFNRRAPGGTCLSALLHHEPGTMARPLNDSKGCGAVMRMAPAGLFMQSPYICGFLTNQQRDEYTFRTGCELGALTHGHPSGYLPAGCLALLIGRIIDGDSLDEALDKAERSLAAYPDHEETLMALQAARQLAADPSVAPSPEAVTRLGEGWVGEEALAIGVYCALVAWKDFARGVRLAVNHGGDSDSTGAIAGNILGALLGSESIPSAWLEKLELRDVIETVASDLLIGTCEGDDWWRRYPGN